MFAGVFKRVVAAHLFLAMVAGLLFVSGCWQLGQSRKVEERPVILVCNQCGAAFASGNVLTGGDHPMFCPDSHCDGFFVSADSISPAAAGGSDLQGGGAAEGRAGTAAGEKRTPVDDVPWDIGDTSDGGGFWDPWEDDVPRDMGDTSNGGLPPVDDPPCTDDCQQTPDLFRN